jgi:hypothetical protein
MLAPKSNLLWKKKSKNRSKVNRHASGTTSFSGFCSAVLSQVNMTSSRLFNERCIVSENVVGSTVGTNVPYSPNVWQ